jgi:hypothetical protein
VNLLHKSIVGIPYQISGVKNNFNVIKLQIRRVYLPEDWLTVVVILSGGTMSMVLLVLVMVENNQDHHYHRFFILSSCCGSKIYRLNNSHGNQRMISTTCLFLLILSYWTVLNLISFHFISFHFLLYSAPSNPKRSNSSDGLDFISAIEIK